MTSARPPSDKLAAVDLVWRIRIYERTVVGIKLAAILSPENINKVEIGRLHRRNVVFNLQLVRVCAEPWAGAFALLNSAEEFTIR